MQIAPLLISLISLFSCQSITNQTQKENTTKMEQSTSSSGNENYEVATLGGGCFWCMEAVYQDLKGVIKVESGYSGGKIKNPTYKEVCSGLTGHAEVTQITFDPKIISYDDILTVFWHVHNPTTLNRQGNDAGTQYRSVIFYHDPIQKQIAEKSMLKASAEKIWPDPIVTQIDAFTAFYKAEAYHQNYFKSNPDQPYCVYVVSPKVEKFRKEFKDKLK